MQIKKELQLESKTLIGAARYRNGFLHVTMFIGGLGVRKLSGAFIQGSDEFVHGADCLGWRAACGADAGT